MYIAEQLKKRSVAEYLLYMWQVEDTLRAYGLDVERMAAEYVPQFGLDEEKSEALKGWYESLVEMMREEGVTERGHLQVVEREKKTLSPALPCRRGGRPFGEEVVWEQTGRSGQRGS